MNRTAPTAAPPAVQRVDLGYCPYCGALRIFAEGAGDEPCSGCVRRLAWMHRGWARRAQTAPPAQEERHASDKS